MLPRELHQRLLTRNGNEATGGLGQDPQSSELVIRLQEVALRQRNPGAAVAFPTQLNDLAQAQTHDSGIDTGKLTRAGDVLDLARDHRVRLQPGLEQLAVGYPFQPGKRRQRRTVGQGAGQRGTQIQRRDGIIGGVGVPEGRNEDQQ